VGYLGASEKPVTSRSSSAFMSTPFDITQRVRCMAATSLETVCRHVRRCVSAEVAIRIVSELCQTSLETPGKHRDLRGHSDAHRCCRKSLMESALVPFGVR
jgi:hypothetical protein